MQLCHLNSILILPWQQWQIVFAERVGTDVGVTLQSGPALPRCVRVCVCEIAIARACISPDAAESLRKKSECWDPLPPSGVAALEKSKDPQVST